MDIKEIGAIIRDYHLKQVDEPKWILPASQHTEQILSLIRQQIESLDIPVETKQTILDRLEGE